jgi:predicted transcriptional regulator
MVIFMTNSRNINENNTPILTNRNDINVYKILKEEGKPLTRKELNQKTKIPRTTLHESLRRLIKKELIIKFIEIDGRQGRPQVQYQIKE